MNIGIVGLGLIGKSMAQIFKENTSHVIFGFDFNKTEMFSALMIKAIDRMLIEDNFIDCDAIIFCVHSDKLTKFILDRADKFKKDALFIGYCGAVKEICEECDIIAKTHHFKFIGGIPTTGKRFSIYKHFNINLFKDAVITLTPTKNTKMLTRVEAKKLFFSAEFKKINFISPPTNKRKKEKK